MSFKFNKLSVLVVEDTVPMRKLLISVLESLGIKNITSADDGKKAFELFQRDNHDIIISDWQMEETNGIELTKMIRSSVMSPNRMVPIILITGYSAWQRVAEARDSGVTEFLVKPFTANDIAKRITHVINKPRDFIETNDFFGPDRRRRIDPAFKGPLKRDQDGKKASDIAFK
ncbi:MAG: response regulator [Alphaproteobacteria bacterium]|jgi:CheY-like chemotaxis protein|nr:response regulator [Alphaproteobacteria bacterium]